MVFPLINICASLVGVETLALRARVSTTPRAPQMLINGKTMCDPYIDTPFGLNSILFNSSACSIKYIEI